MTGSKDRFYQLSFNDRNAFWGDIGSRLKIQGLVVGGDGVSAFLMLPGAQIHYVDEALDSIRVHHLGAEEWNEFIRRSDDPEILVGSPKVFQRKIRYQISGLIQQKVWAADGFRCAYCGKQMGEVGLTIDHFYPLEGGGVNDESNYLSACVACNKKKGNMEPAEWCEKLGIDIERFKNILKNRKLP